MPKDDFLKEDVAIRNNRWGMGGGGYNAPIDYSPRRACQPPEIKSPADYYPESINFGVDNYWSEKPWSE